MNDLKNVLKKPYVSLAMNLIWKDEKDMNNMKRDIDINIVALTIAIVIALLAFIPWLVFWAINTLFAYSIPYTISTCAAFWVLMTFLKGEINITQRWDSFWQRETVLILSSERILKGRGLIFGVILSWFELIMTILLDFQ